MPEFRKKPVVIRVNILERLKLAGAVALLAAFVVGPFAAVFYGGRHYERAHPVRQFILMSESEIDKCFEQQGYYEFDERWVVVPCR